MVCRGNAWYHQPNMAISVLYINFGCHRNHFSGNHYRPAHLFIDVLTHSITEFWRYIIKSMDYIIRDMREDERGLLEEFLYQAIYVPEGFKGEVPRSVIRDDPKCRAAYEGFGERPDDRALVAEVDGNVVGACWVRTTDEYGHIDDATPSFSISLFEQYRGCGIGTALMTRMLDELQSAGYARTSLSVQKENPALRLYERLGFRIIGNGADESEWLMVREFITE